MTNEDGDTVDSDHMETGAREQPKSIGCTNTEQKDRPFPESFQFKPEAKGNFTPI